MFSHITTLHKLFEFDMCACVLCIRLDCLRSHNSGDTYNLLSLRLASITLICVCVRAWSFRIKLLHRHWANKFQPSFSRFAVVGVCTCRRYFTCILLSTQASERARASNYLSANDSRAHVSGEGEGLRFSCRCIALIGPIWAAGFPCQNVGRRRRVRVVPHMSMDTRNS